MSSSLPDFEELHVASKRLVNEVCERFEVAYRQDDKTRIADHLEPVPERLRPLVLAELLRIECEYKGLVYPPSSLATGIQIGDYRLLEELGRGGFGVVFRAVQIRSQKTVAIKVFHKITQDDPQFRQRFRREAEATARFKHPNLVGVIETGEFGPICFLVVDYVEGPTLAAWLADHVARDVHVPIRSAVSIVADLAEAIHHAHECGVLHRDLKPRNVLLKTGNRSPSVNGIANHSGPADSAKENGLQPIITDFGLALLLGMDSDLSHSGEIIGTPTYMAPEQISGNRKSVNERTDLYALGAILYELLIGKPPFTADSVMELLFQISRTEPAELRIRRRDIPAEVEAICLKCLEKNPARRYSTGLSLADDLRRYLNGTQTHARPRGTIWRARRWVRLHPVRSVFIASALSIFLILFVDTVGYTRRIATINNGLSQALSERDETNLQLRKIAYSGAIRRIDAILKSGEANLAQRELEQWIPKNDEADLRSWEWYYLLEKINTGEKSRWSLGTMYCLAYAPDGRALAAACADGRVYVLNAETGQNLVPPLQHPAEVNEVVWTPDGKKLATIDNVGLVRVWSLDGTPPIEMMGHTEKISSLAISPNGLTLATAGRDGSVRLWDIRGQSPSTLLISRQNQSATAVSFTSDGSSVMVGWSDTRVQVIELATARKTDLGTQKAPVISIRTRPKTNFAVVAGRLDVTIWEATTNSWEWRSKMRFHQNEIRINDAALSPDSKSVAVVGNGLVKVWNLEGPHLEATMCGHNGRIWAVAYHPNGRFLATAGSDGTIRIWDLSKLKSLSQTVTIDGVKGRIASLPDGISFAVIRSNPDTIELWRWAENGPTRIASQQLEPANWTGLPVVMPDGSSLLVRQGMKVYQFNVISPESSTEFANRAVFTCQNLSPQFEFTRSQEVPPIHKNANGPKDLAISPDGQTIAGPLGSELLVWDQVSKKMKFVLNGPLRMATTLSFNTDGSVLAKAGKEQICLWNTKTGVLETRIQNENLSTVKALAFSPDGKSFASGGEDNTIHIWDPNGAIRQQFIGHQGAIQALAYSSCGRTLASGSNDGTVRLWNVETGSELLNLTGPGGPICYLKFSIDGNILFCAASGNEEQIKVFRYQIKR